MASIMIDWSEPDEAGKWENCGQRVLRETLESPEHTQFKEVAKELDVLEEGGESLVPYYEETINSYSDPMMNYGYLLETEPKDEDVLKVVLNTNCSVMYNSETEEHFIVLCGGGMDLSQDIAISYVWLEKWIPEDLITQVCKQRGLSIGGGRFDELKKAILEQAENYEGRFKRLREDWKNL